MAEPELVRATSSFFSELDGQQGGRHAPRNKEPAAAAFAHAHAPVQPHGNNDNNNAADTNDRRRRERDVHAEANSGVGPVRPDTRFGAESSGKQLQHDVHWLELGLCKALTRAVAHLGYLHPTPVQSAAIPHVLAGYDVCARAVTGSGKTAALLLPLVHRLVTTSIGGSGGAKSKFATPDGAPKRNVMNGVLRSLILLPSRELGTQCYDFAASLGHFCTSLKTVLVIGGVAAQAQETALASGADIVVATPGRISDLLYNYSNIEQARHTPFSSKSSAVVAGSSTNRGRKFDLSALELVALDECDELLTSETLRPQVEDIFNKFLPPLEKRQTVLLSATLTRRVDEFIENFMKPEVRVVDIGHVAFAAQLRQHFIRCSPASDKDAADAAALSKIKSKKNAAVGDDEDNNNGGANADDDDDADERDQRMQELTEHAAKRKTPFLVAACQHFYGEKAAEPRVLIFAKHRSTVHRLCVIFQHLGLAATELRGDLDVDMRARAVADFSSGAARYLFTTDVASRGLDLPAVSTVVNFDLPPTLSSYVHRVGRTARIGRGGIAVSLVDDELDGELMRRIIALSKSDSAHQVTTVKRREVPEALVAEAATAVNGIFPAVKRHLASEVVERQLGLAERKLVSLDQLTERQKSIKAALSISGGDQRQRKLANGGASSAAAAISQLVLPTPKKQWALSRAERVKREETAKKVYTEELESKLSVLQAQAAEPDGAIERANQAQITERRNARDKKQAAKDRQKQANKALRQKHAKKLQAGVVKKEKQKKLREAKREKRTERMAAGKSGGGSSKKRKEKKSSKRYKRHK